MSALCHHMIPMTPYLTLMNMREVMTWHYMKYSLGSFIDPRVPQNVRIAVRLLILKNTEKFTNSINKRRLSRVNQVNTNLKGMNSGNQTPKVDVWKPFKMWGIGIERDKKNIPNTTQNTVRGVTRTLTKTFRTRDAMIRW